MSPLWKSELLVRPGRAECRVQVRSAWRREVLGECSAAGAGAAAIGVAVAGLAAQGTGRLPGRARLLVPDEMAYIALLPASAAWHTAQAAAAAHFAAVLGRHDLIVQVAAMPGSRWWLAAAIEPADLAAWRQVLAEHGVALDAVELALLHDLRAIARHVDDRSVVALLRDEGVMLLRVHDGAPVALSWERCNPHSQPCIEQRLFAFAQTDDGAKPDPLILLCRSAAQHDEWQRLAKAHRWTLLTPKAPAPRADEVAA